MRGYGDIRNRSDPRHLRARAAIAGSGEPWSISMNVTTTATAPRASDAQLKGLPKLASAANALLYTRSEGIPVDQRTRLPTGFGDRDATISGAQGGDRSRTAPATSRPPAEPQRVEPRRRSPGDGGLRGWQIRLTSPSAETRARRALQISTCYGTEASFSLTWICSQRSDFFTPPPAARSTVLTRGPRSFATCP
jgi:hypothetical protein